MMMRSRYASGTSGSLTSCTCDTMASSSIEYAQLRSSLHCPALPASSSCLPKGKATSALPPRLNAPDSRSSTSEAGVGQRRPPRNPSVAAKSTSAGVPPPAGIVTFRAVLAVSVTLDFLFAFLPTAFST